MSFLPKFCSAVVGRPRFAGVTRAPCTSRLCLCKFVRVESGFPQTSHVNAVASSACCASRFARCGDAIPWWNRLCCPTTIREGNFSPHSGHGYSPLTASMLDVKIARPIVVVAPVAPVGSLLETPGQLFPAPCDRSEQHATGKQTGPVPSTRQCVRRSTRAECTSMGRAGARVRPFCKSASSCITTARWFASSMMQFRVAAAS
jgi:hypothetical protein